VGDVAQAPSLGRVGVKERTAVLEVDVPDAIRPTKRIDCAQSEVVNLLVNRGGGRQVTTIENSEERIKPSAKSWEIRTRRERADHERAALGILSERTARVCVDVGYESPVWKSHA
jgi:hypothetical protein